MENNIDRTSSRTSYNYSESAPVSVKRTASASRTSSNSVLDAMLSAQLTEAKMKQRGMNGNSGAFGFVGDVIRRYFGVILALTIIGAVVAVKVL